MKSDPLIWIYLILIRGLPGSGKSTLAQMFRDHLHVEADMFFNQPDGTYRYDKTRINQAHAWCLGKTEDALKTGQPVVVSNTFTRKWEIEPYIELARRLSVPYVVLTTTGKFSSSHAVPEEAIKRMAERWENL